MTQTQALILYLDTLNELYSTGVIDALTAYAFDGRKGNELIIQQMMAAPDQQTAKEIAVAFLKWHYTLSKIIYAIVILTTIAYFVLPGE